MAELVDARDLKSLDGNVVWVRVPPPAPAFARAASEGCHAEADRRRRACSRELRLGRPPPLIGYAWRGHAKTADRRTGLEPLSAAENPGADTAQNRGTFKMAIPSQARAKEKV